MSASSGIGSDDLAGLRAGGKSAMARALAALEREGESDAVADLLDAAWRDQRGHAVGLTGPPGVGKSSLINRLIAVWRGSADTPRTVGVIAVDPSSRRTGGALLGDRTRLRVDPDDQGVFVRSMAARDRLGGLAALTMPAVVLMRAVYDVVIVETVGVGQSETDVAQVTDTVVFCVQPGSGDSLQFMKAGIMEVPHIAVVTKADIGAAARRAASDVGGALGLAEAGGGEWTVSVLMVSSQTGEGVAELIAEIDRHFETLREGGVLERERRDHAMAWLTETIAERFGREGLARATGELTLGPGDAPFGRARAIARSLAV